MKVWITRDDKEYDSQQGDIVIWNSMYPKTPKKDGSGVWENGGKCMADVNKHDFRNLFGFTPRKGSCKQYELTLKEMK